MKQLLFLLAFIFSTQVIFAENKTYDITIKVEGIKNEVALLAYYYGDKKYIKDSIPFNDKGIATIKGEKDISSGVYLVVFPSLNNKYFEFIINEPTFQIETDTADFVMKMKVKNSLENKIFYEDQQKLYTISKQIEELTKQYESLDTLSAEREKIKSQIIEKNNQIKDGRILLIKNNSKTLYGKLLNVLQEIEIPKEIDSTQAMSYYRNAYLNSIDFKDAALIQTPVIEGKIKRFLDKHTAPSTDSITRACDLIIARAKENYDFYQFTVNLLINKYAASNIMGHESVYVYLAEKYYLSGLADWADEKTIEKLKKRVTALKPTLIGKIAPEILMTDINGVPTSLSKFVPKHDYTVVAWWNSTCGHCKKEIPKLKAIYDSILLKENVGIFAVTTEHQDDEWKKVIETFKLNDFTNVIDLTNTSFAQSWYDVYSTPLILVLDNKGKIIAKKITVEDIPGLIEFENKIKLNKSK